MFCKEVVHKQPWWRVTPANQISYELSYTKMAIVAGVLGVGAYALRRRKPKLADLIKVDPLRVAPEGLVPGNPLIEGGKIPDCQVQVLVEKDGTYYVVGAGCRIEDCLITPAHNLQTGFTAYIRRGEKMFPLQGHDMPLAADVVAYKVPESQWSQLGVSRARLAPLGRASSVAVTSCCDNKYSVATLAPHKDMLGRCIYYGSTLPGFSGSVYMNGTACVGMHCHGGAQAGGYELLYLYQRLKLALQQIPEDSAEFFLNAYSSQDPRYEELSEDAVILRSEEGHYHLTTSEVLRKLRSVRNKASQDWNDMMEEEELEQELRNRGEYIPECLEAMPHGHQGEASGSERRVKDQRRSESLPASASISHVPESQFTGQSRQTTAYSELSSSQLRKLLKSRKLQRQRLDTAQPTRQQQLSGALLRASSKQQQTGGRV